jgi:hypothetical protein
VTSVATGKRKPAIKTPVKAKPPRTRRRVEDSENTAGAARREVRHREAEDTPEQKKAFADAVVKMVDGEVYLSAQASEVVPVAQFANVTIGPVRLDWKFTGADMALLADVDWSVDEPVLDAAQQAAWDRAANAARGTLNVIETVIAEDRETVEESVRLHNEREAAKKKESK